MRAVLASMLAVLAVMFLNVCDAEVLHALYVHQ